MAISYTVRPGGLTALGIVNFIIAGGMFFGLIANGWLLTCAGMFGAAGSTVVDTAYLTGLLIFDTIVISLLVVSGIGYLSMNRGTGLIVGNVYVLISVARAVFQLIQTRDMPFGAGGLDMGFIIGNLYVVVIAVFINIVFADVWRKKGALSQQLPSSAGLSVTPQDEHAQAGPLKLIFSFSLRQSLRGASGVLTVFLGSSILLWLAQIPYVSLDIANVFQNGTSMGMDPSGIDSRIFVQAVISFLRPLLAQYLGILEADQGWAADMLVGPSGVYDLSVLMLSAIIPLFAVMISSTQIASDNKNGGLRFLLPRVGREELFQAKLASSLVIAWVLVIVINLLNFSYFTLHYGIGDPGELFVRSLRGIAVDLMLTVPYVLIGITISGLIDSPGVAWIAATGIALWPVIPFAISSQWAPVKILEFLVPHRAAIWAYHPDAFPVIAAILASATYSAFFYWGGKKLFAKRDL